MFLLIFVFLLASLDRPVPDSFDRALSLTLVGCSILCVGFLSEIVTTFLTRRLWKAPDRRQPLLKVYLRIRMAFVVLPVIVYAYCLWGLHWDHLVIDVFRLKSIWLIREALTLLPYLLMVLLEWSAFHRVEQAFHATSQAAYLHPFWSKREYLVFQARQQWGMPLTVGTLLITLNGTARWLFPELTYDSELYSWLQLGWLALMLPILPWLFTFVLPTLRLPAGPLRHELEALADRLGFRCTDILLWNTHRKLANALVTGFLPRPRYVILSDLLIETLHPEQIEAVFGHELGHLRYRHFFQFLVFALLSILGFSLLGQWLVNDLSQRWPAPLPGWELHGLSIGDAIAYGLVLTGVGLYVWLAFGWLMRTCERQADLFGCKAVKPLPLVSVATVMHEHNGYLRHVVVEENHPQALHPHGIRVFISALERVAEVNGLSRERPSWRHGSIASRVQFLEELIVQPDKEERFLRRARLAKLLLFVVLASVNGLLWWWTGGVMLM